MHSGNEHERANRRPRALRLHPDDNVATVLEDAGPGTVEVVGDAAGQTITLVERVAAGHKVAARPIAAGEPVVKYGVTIGLASSDIAAGGWVHTHNCRSRFDERSATLDRHTGAPTDTTYE
jgi:altronate dehydratase small subunit